MPDVYTFQDSGKLTLSLAASNDSGLIPLRGKQNVSVGLEATNGDAAGTFTFKVWNSPAQVAGCAISMSAVPTKVASTAMADHVDLGVCSGYLQICYTRTGGGAAQTYNAFVRTEE